MNGIELDRLLTCISGRWSPGIGDPSVMGWVTVAAYALAALACAAAAIRRREERAFWVFLAICLGFLCINKELDLQSALTAAGRCLAQAQGWYGQRREVQFGFVLVILALGGVVLVAVLTGMRRKLGRVGVAIVGFGVLITFVAVRAIGFHHVDAMISVRIGEARVNWILELTGIVLIAANALAALRSAGPGGVASPVQEGDPPRT